MLRNSLLLLAAGLIVIGAGFEIAGSIAVGLHLLVWGTIALVALAIERWRYPGNAGDILDGWTATGERFEDPETGRVMEVQYHPASGARRYAPASDSTRIPASPD